MSFSARILHSYKNNTIASPNTLGSINIYASVQDYNKVVCGIRRFVLNIFDFGGITLPHINMQILVLSCRRSRALRPLKKGICESSISVAEGHLGT